MQHITPSTGTMQRSIEILCMWQHVMCLKKLCYLAVSFNTETFAEYQLRSIAWWNE